MSGVLDIATARRALVLAIERPSDTEAILARVPEYVGRFVARFSDTLIRQFARAA
jgi:hypothetical protein